MVGITFVGITVPWAGLGLTGVDWAKPGDALKIEVSLELKMDVLVFGAATTGVKAE